MNELIKLNEVNIGDDSVQTVNARDLHTFLEVGKDFSNWIKGRISKYGFEENVDYVIVENLSSPDLANAKARPQKLLDYHISVDMAKELSMVENNDKGREARKYFIECEKKLRKSIEDSIPKTLPDALEAYALEIRKHERTKLLLEEAKEVIESNKPKIRYHDIVLSCPDLLTVRQIAQDYGISAQKLNNILNEKNVQYKDKSGVWLLYISYNAQGYAQTFTHTYQDNDGNYHSKLHLKWTQKGRLFIYELLKEEGILPICEQEG